MSNREPKIADRYAIGGRAITDRWNYEIESEGPGRTMYVRWFQQVGHGLLTLDAIARDTLVSYMPDPANPQPGDRFLLQHEPYTVTGRAFLPGDPDERVYIRKDNDPTEVRWLLADMRSDRPLRTIVPARGPAASLVIMDEPNDFAVQAAITEHAVVMGSGRNWPATKRVAVEWVGDDQFGGVVTYPGFPEDGKRKTYGYTPGSCLGWEPWTAPAPEPVVQDWKVTTTDRAAKTGEMIVLCNDDDDGFTVAPEYRDRNTIKAVVTAVEPLDPPKPPRIRTVYRAPKQGERYIWMNSVQTAAVNHPVQCPSQVLVVE